MRFAVKPVVASYNFKAVHACPSVLEKSRTMSGFASVLGAGSDSAGVPKSRTMRVGLSVSVARAIESPVVDSISTLVARGFETKRM